MIVECANLLHARRVIPDNTSRLGNIFQILAATRIGTVRRSHERQRVLYSLVTHLPEGVSEQRMPVAIAKVNRQRRTISLQFNFESGNEFAVLLIERANAAKQFIVCGDLKQAFARDVPTAQYIFKEGNYVVHSLRPTKRDDQNCIERTVHL